MINPRILSNRTGIPRLEAENVSVSATAANVNFRSDLFRNIPFSGLILFKIPSFTAPTTAVPVIFNTGGNTINLTIYGGTQVTTTELAGGGIILAYYEGDTLQVVNVFSL